MPEFKIYTEKIDMQGFKGKKLELVSDKDVLKRVALAAGKIMKKDVPAVTINNETLADKYTAKVQHGAAVTKYSWKVTGKNVTSNMARYLYEGLVYRPNIPVFESYDEDGKGVGDPIKWYSIPKKCKHITKDKIKYPGGTDHWDKQIKTRGTPEWTELRDETHKIIKEVWKEKYEGK